ncbi:class I SAM-dependent methyltransferase [Nocardioides carbamazepini]|uniref:class I SAM-dependent methyltransferase n=1 Tax=Nocardioides carbamazepini TaxID=2854259 RepID=UPI002149AE90|nr:class I SAM-dependent methyltransferase [Nocardioides carbamazepini]MCR1781554.1 class I SAM-dependent methyltransferase [Nocardioides carbamazepini]
MQEIKERLRAFYDSRIGLPIPDDGLVLDVGSGDKPSWRADVLLDRYPDDAYAGQRSGTGRTRVDRPLFDADAAAMPFADGVFDYAICSHVLEHVTDPVAVVGELTRVAKAGYIEVPEAAAAKIIDFPSHLWWCRLDRSTDPPTLVMEAKRAASFDPEIEAYLRRSELADPVKRLIDSRHHHNVIALRWSGTQPVRTEGRHDPDFVERTVNAEAHHTRGGEAIVARALTAALTYRKPRRRTPIAFDDVVRPDLRRGDGALLEPRIYRFA